MLAATEFKHGKAAPDARCTEREYTAFVAIVEEYIVDNSPFEINISASLKSDIMSYLPRDRYASLRQVMQMTGYARQSCYCTHDLVDTNTCRQTQYPLNSRLRLVLCCGDPIDPIRTTAHHQAWLQRVRSCQTRVLRALYERRRRVLCLPIVHAIGT